MALTFDPANRIIESTASITDLPAFHAALRDWEDSPDGMIHPVTHTWKALDLGGAYFYQADGINGWRLKFPNAGNYRIDGNLNIDIVAVSGVYVERKTSAAYVTTAIGGSGATAEEIATAVWSQLLTTTLSAAQVQRILLAGIAGKTQGIGTDTESYLAEDGETARITATFDRSGNRTSVTLNGG